MQMSVLNDLVSLLQLENVETNVYVGQSQDLGFPAVFGGQVLGQSLMAAWQTVESWRPHSLHSYFLRPGDVKAPIYYEVDQIRTGTSFCTRRVVAKQHGRAILNLSASFQVDEPGFDHQAERPSVPGPDGIPSELDEARKIKDKIPEKVREKFTCDRPIEIRVIDPIDFFNPRKRPAIRYSWFKAIEKLPDDPKIHFALLAYASDFGLGTTAILPHGKSFIDPKMQVASLDHTMWFHRNFRMDEWLLYAKDSPSASGARGFNRGQIFTKDGALIASVAQESLIRQRP
jgi:acyl-CoA thioesterase-2